MDRTFLFADLAGFAALTEAHGDADAAETAERFESLVRAALQPGLRLVKTIGDAVMVVGDDPRATVRLRLLICRSVEAEDRFPGVRIGLHTGSAVERAGDFFGSVVNVAARAAAYAHTGQVVATKAVAAAARGLDDIAIRELGAVRLKHIPSPVALYSLSDRSAAASESVVDPVCHMRIAPDAAPARVPFRHHTWYFCSLDCARLFINDPDRYIEV